MKEFKIEVKSYMLKKSEPNSDFQFMAEKNNNVPMPLMIMYGVKLEETRGMVKMRLHGDIKDTITERCMCCGRLITNPVSRYFGIGPVCGNHNYVNPFDTEEELHKAVGDFRQKLVNTVWEGWIIKSAIKYIDDDSAVYTKLAEMPCEAEDVEEDISKLEMPYEIITDDVVVEEPKLPVIKVRIASHNKVGDDYSAYLSFPYNAELVSTVKNLPIRFWAPDTKEWEITCDELVDLQTTIKTHTFEVEGQENIKVETAELPKDFIFKTTPYKYQVEGIEYGLSHSRWLLCDQQGVGKTKQIIDLAVARKYKDGLKHCLIICCVNGLKWNWEEEIHKHSNESVKILGEYITKKGKKKIGSNKDKLNDVLNLKDSEEFFVVTNVESLRNAEISDALAQACDDEIIGMVAIDEFHAAKNSFSLQGKGILKLQPKYRVGMTGTPLMNTPLDFYQIFKWLGYQPYSFNSFRNHFCIFGGYEGREVVGYKNTEDITKLLDNIMLRRTKDEVLDLPDKVYINEYVELTNEQDKVYSRAFELACQMLDKDEENFNPLAEIIRLRQVTGGCGVFEDQFSKNPKLDRLEELVAEAINQGEKIVVFSQWTEMIKLIISRLEKYGIAVITGDTPDSERQIIVNKFQNDPETKVFIGSIKAVGVGLTLTAGSTVIFVDEPWTDAAKEQCVDRCHRIGTAKRVTVHTIMAHDTVDERVHDIIEHKAGLAAKLVDGQEVYDKKECCKYLLSR